MPHMLGSKARVFSVFDRIPIVSEFADPIVATVLLAIIAVTAGALLLSSQIFPHDSEARSHVIQIAGGLVLILGLYYASVTVRELRAQQYLERLSTLIGQLSSTNEAVRVGTLRLLQSAALERPTLPSDSTTEGAAQARSRAIWDTITQVSRENDSDAAVLAALICRELAAQGFPQPDASLAVGIRDSTPQ
jgi:hypothetical protein